MGGTHVTAIAFLLKLASSFYFFASFVLELDALVTEDLRHEFA